MTRGSRPAHGNSVGRRLFPHGLAETGIPILTCMARVLKYRMLPVDRVKSFAVERHVTAHKIYMVAELDSVRILLIPGESPLYENDGGFLVSSEFRSITIKKDNTPTPTQVTEFPHISLVLISSLS